MGVSTTKKLFSDWREFAKAGQALQSKARRGRTHAIPFLHSCPEMQRFLSTFSTVAWQDAPDVPPEWNPFTQRILLRGKPRQVSELGADFEQLEYAVTGAMHMIHEACHVLTWEPLFVGALPALDASTFVEMSMGFEGFCFWYPDIVVAKPLRDRYPNGDVVLSRRGASSPHFRPHLAFDALGIRDTDQIRQIYLDAFSGLATPLASPAGLAHAASRSLGKRIYGFYAEGKVDVACLYTELNRVDLFGGFARRFWLRGLPSVLPDELLARTERGELSLDEYCDELAGTGFSFIARLDPARLGAVAFRRSLQTRAYFAWTLQHVLRERLFTAPADASPPAAEVDAIADQLDHYLTALEQLLLALREPPGRSPARSAAAAALAAADRRYDRTVRRPLARARLWVRHRRQIFPNDEAPLPWGPLQGTRATPRRCEHALTRCLEIGRSLARQRRPLPATTSAVCRLPGSDAGRARWVRSHDQFMTHPEVLPRWSVQLADHHPGRGSFRELLFVYH